VLAILGRKALWLYVPGMRGLSACVPDGAVENSSKLTGLEITCYRIKYGTVQCYGF